MISQQDSGLEICWVSWMKMVKDSWMEIMASFSFCCISFSFCPLKPMDFIDKVMRDDPFNEMMGEGWSESLADGSFIPGLDDSDNVIPGI